MASLGAKVLQSRSVEFAKKYNVVFEVRSSFNQNPGTIVKEEVASMEQVVVRGVARMVPDFAVYLQRMRRPFVDGGYYTKTRENRFLAGPLPIEGAYIIGALSGALTTTGTPAASARR